MRDIVWFLNPDFDTFGDMVSRMRDFARTALNGIELQFEVSDLPPAQRLSLEFRRAVFFSFKEILHNIAKHAGASRVRICLSLTDGRFVLRAEDNGRGFAPETKGTGHGLGSLRQRADEIGGTVTLASTPGRGTTVELAARCA
jgi:signal transduction histidine kinase